MPHWTRTALFLPKEEGRRDPATEGA
jgi:hypothetical protein